MEWNYWGTSTHGGANLSKTHECCSKSDSKMLPHLKVCPHRAWFWAPGGQSLRPQLFELHLCGVGGAGTAQRDSSATRTAGPYRCGKKMKYKSEVVKKVKSTFFFTIFGRFEMPWCVVLIPDWDESCCQTWRTKSSQSGMTKMTVTRQTMLNKMWQSLKVSMCNVHQLCTSKK